MAEVSVLIWGMVAKRTKMPIGTRRVSEANQISFWGNPFEKSAEVIAGAAR